MRIVGIIFAVAVAVAFAQTRLASTQNNPMVDPLVSGLGTAIQTNGDGTGQINVLRPVRTISAADYARLADCHGMIVSAVPAGGYSFEMAPSAVPQFVNGCEISFHNDGPGVLNIIGVTGTNAALQIAANTSCILDFDGAVWQPEC